MLVRRRVRSCRRRKTQNSVPYSLSERRLTPSHIACRAAEFLDDLSHLVRSAGIGCNNLVKDAPRALHFATLPQARSSTDSAAKRGFPIARIRILVSQN